MKEEATEMKRKKHAREENLYRRSNEEENAPRANYPACASAAEEKKEEVYLHLSFLKHLESASA